MVMSRDRWESGAAHALAVAAVLVVLACGVTAQAQVTIRTGKAQAQNFAFIAADVGVAAGIFKKHGIDLEIANFGGDARLVQAMSANAIDFALGGGPTIAFEVKGAPMLAVAAMADRAPHHHDGGGQGRPGEDRGRPQGPHRQRLDHGLADLLAGPGIVALPRLGRGRHQDRAARHHHRSGGRAQDPPGRRRGDRDEHGPAPGRGRHRPCPGAIRRPHPGFSRSRDLCAQGFPRRQSRGGSQISRGVARERAIHARPQERDDRYRHARRRSARGPSPPRITTS